MVRKNRRTANRQEGFGVGSFEDCYERVSCRRGDDSLFDIRSEWSYIKDSNEKDGILVKVEDIAKPTDAKIIIENIQCDYIELKYYTNREEHRLYDTSERGNSVEIVIDDIRNAREITISAYSKSQVNVGYRIDHTKKRAVSIKESDSEQSDEGDSSSDENIRELVVDEDYLSGGDKSPSKYNEKKVKTRTNHPLAKTRFKKPLEKSIKKESDEEGYLTYFGTVNIPITKRNMFQIVKEHTLNTRQKTKNNASNELQYHSDPEVVHPKDHTTRKLTIKKEDTRMFSYRWYFRNIQYEPNDTDSYGASSSGNTIRECFHTIYCKDGFLFRNDKYYVVGGAGERLQQGLYDTKSFAIIDEEEYDIKELLSGNVQSPGDGTPCRWKYAIIFYPKNNRDMDESGSSENTKPEKKKIDISHPDFYTSTEKNAGKTFKIRIKKDEKEVIGAEFEWGLPHENDETIEMSTEDSFTSSAPDSCLTSQSAEEMSEVGSVGEQSTPSDRQPEYSPNESQISKIDNCPSQPSSTPESTNILERIHKSLSSAFDQAIKTKKMTGNQSSPDTNRLKRKHEDIANREQFEESDDTLALDEEEDDQMVEDSEEENEELISRENKKKKYEHTVNPISEKYGPQEEGDFHHFLNSLDEFKPCDWPTFDTRGEHEEIVIMEARALYFHALHMTDSVYMRGFLQKVSDRFTQCECGKCRSKLIRPVEICNALLKGYKNDHNLSESLHEIDDMLSKEDCESLMKPYTVNLKERAKDFYFLQVYKTGMSELSIQFLRMLTDILLERRCIIKEELSTRYETLETQLEGVTKKKLDECGYDSLSEAIQVEDNIRYLRDLLVQDYRSYAHEFMINWTGSSTLNIYKDTSMLNSELKKDIIALLGIHYYEKWLKNRKSEFDCMYHNTNEGVDRCRFSKAAASIEKLAFREFGCNYMKDVTMSETVIPALVDCYIGKWRECSYIDHVLGGCNNEANCEKLLVLGSDFGSRLAKRHLLLYYIKCKKHEKAWEYVERFRNQNESYQPYEMFTDILYTNDPHAQETARKEFPACIMRGDDSIASEMLDYLSSLLAFKEMREIYTYYLGRLCPDQFHESRFYTVRFWDCLKNEIDNSYKDPKHSISTRELENLYEYTIPHASSNPHSFREYSSLLFLYRLRGLDQYYWDLLACFDPLLYRTELISMCYMGLKDSLTPGHLSSVPDIENDTRTQQIPRWIEDIGKISTDQDPVESEPITFFDNSSVARINQDSKMKEITSSLISVSDYASYCMLLVWMSRDLMMTMRLYYNTKKNPQPTNQEKRRAFILEYTKALLRSLIKASEKMYLPSDPTNLTPGPSKVHNSPILSDCMLVGIYVFSLAKLRFKLEIPGNSNEFFRVTIDDHTNRIIGRFCNLNNFKSFDNARHDKIVRQRPGVGNTAHCKKLNIFDIFTFEALYNFDRSYLEPHTDTSQKKDANTGKRDRFIESAKKNLQKKDDLMLKMYGMSQNTRSIELLDSLLMEKRQMTIELNRSSVTNVQNSSILMGDDYWSWGITESMCNSATLGLSEHQKRFVNQLTKSNMPEISALGLSVQHYICSDPTRKEIIYTELSRKMFDRPVMKQPYYINNRK